MHYNIFNFSFIPDIRKFTELNFVDRMIMKLDSASKKLRNERYKLRNER